MLYPCSAREHEQNTALVRDLAGRNTLNCAWVRTDGTNELVLPLIFNSKFSQRSAQRGFKVGHRRKLPCGHLDAAEVMGGMGSGGVDGNEPCGARGVLSDYQDDQDFNVRQTWCKSRLRSLGVGGGGVVRQMTLEDREVRGKTTRTDDVRAMKRFNSPLRRQITRALRRHGAHRVPLTLYLPDPPWVL